MSFSDLFRSNFTNLFLGPGKTREDQETAALYGRVRAAYDASPYADAEAASDFRVGIVTEACERAKVTPSSSLVVMLFELTRQLLAQDGLLHGFPDVDNLATLGLEEGVTLRAYLRRKERFLADRARLEDVWREKVIRILEGILGYLPASAFSEDDEENGNEGPEPLKAPLIDLCETPAEVVERTLVTMFDDDVVKGELFVPIREQLDRNALRASGIAPNERQATNKEIVLPTAARGFSNVGLAEAYFAGTGFEGFFTCPVPFSIPFPVRFEHTHIMGGTGHGKTQLLQRMIHEDLGKARTDGRSVVVIDSQGDLIRTVSHLSCFDPSTEGSLADRLLLIDPNDVEFPVCLNMFDWQRDRLARFAPVEREKFLNGTVELYEYLFGALLGAELTQKQGVIFKYLARLMLEIPDATIHTFRELMEDGEPFRPYMEALPGTARRFFETRFFDRSFNETKKQILTRLWGVLANPTFERMFSHPRSKVDLFEATGSGKIVLINTAKDLLKQDGCAIFGRFFIALLAQAAMQRAALPSHERRPAFVYLDEAQDYFDENIEHLLAQARKYRVGMVLAHQNLDQLSTELRASIMASTSIKFAGGVSAKDARTLAQDMNCEPDFLQGMRKRKDRTEFACWIRNLTPQAIRVEVPLGEVEKLPTLAEADYAVLVAANRSRYCAPASEAVLGEAPATPPTRPRAPEAAPPSAPSPKARVSPTPSSEASAPRPKPADIEPRLLGRGGRQHKYLQQLVKQIAEERGYRAVIEETILDGAGRVDVSLSRAGTRIACEVSVTSTQDQELGNVEKCLAAGYDQVILLSPERRQLNLMRKFLGPNFEPEISARVHFLLPEEFLAHLDSLGKATETSTDTVRGYKVTVTRTHLSEAEAQMRRQTVAQVMARSLRRMGKDG